MLIQRCVFAIAKLDDAWNFHEIDTGAIIEGTSYCCAGNDQHVQTAIILDQGVGNCSATAQVAEPKRVMAVHKDAGIVQTGCH
ncbi:hypothetical protein D3C71_1866310 [compost metagenome]